MKKEYEGEWFLPENAVVRLPGVLHIDTELQSLVLKLYSSISFNGDKITLAPHRKIFRTQILLGKVYGLNSDVTLISGMGSGDEPVLEKWVGGEMFELLYSPAFAIVGKHFTNLNDVQFSNYSFQFTYLGEWFDALTVFIKEDWGSGRFSAEYNKKPDAIVSINVDGRMKICSGIHRTGELHKALNLSIEHWVEFEFQTPRPLQEFYGLAEKFLKFLYFAVGTPIQMIGCHTRGQGKEDIEIYHDFMKQPQKLDWINAQEMFLCPTHFTEGERLTYIENWYKEYDKFQAAYDSFCHAVCPFCKNGSVTVTNIEFTNGIFNIASAIETFFNRDQSIDYKKMREQFTLKRNSIFGKVRSKATELSLDEDNMKFLNDNFKLPKIKSDYPFKDIVLYYLRDLKDALENLIPDSDFETFAAELKNCRNSLVHLEHETSEELHTSYNLYNLFSRSQMLFVAMTLHKIGVSKQKINYSLARSRQFDEFYTGTGY